MLRLRFGDFGRVLMRFASAQVFSNGLRMLAGFLVVSLVDPELYGQFTGVGIYLGYILLGHGGIINGLGRELPYALGKGNDQEAKEMASSVFWLTAVLSFLAALVFLVFAIKNFLSGESLLAWIFLSHTVMALLQLPNKQFLPVLYRTNRDFDSLSKQNIITGVGNVMSVVLVWFFGIYGLLARGVFLAVFTFSLLFKNKPYPLQLTFKESHFHHLFKVGWPIFTVGYVNTLWLTLLNNFVYSIGGAFNFGLYALSNIIQGAIGIIPSAFSQVIYPRMSIMLGEGRKVSEILRANIKPLFLQLGVMLVIGAVGAMLLPILIPVILPKYVGGIKAAQWMMFLPAVQSFGALNSIYNVVKKQGRYFLALILGAIVGSVFIFIRYNLKGFQLELFPQGLIVGQGVQQLLALGFLRFLKDE